MRNKQILLSGRAVTTNAANVPADRYSFLHLSDAEPNLGTASANDYVLVYNTHANTSGNRLWSEKLITGYNHANAAYESQNITGTYANNAYLHANAAYASQNVTGTYANNAYLHANASYIHANASYAAQNITGTYANNAYLHANSAYASQNVTGTYANNAYLHANASYIHANAAYESQNVTGTYANNAYIRANNSLNANVGGTVTGNVTIIGNLSSNILTTTGSGGDITGANAIFATFIFAKNTDLQLLTNSAYRHANSGFIHANAGFSYANAVYTSLSGDITRINNINATQNTHVNSAFLKANNSYTHANAAYVSQNVTGTYANNAYLHANASFIAQNITGTYANSAYRHANSAYASQNVTGTYANNAYLHANTAFESQNVTGTYANNAYLHANAAFQAQNITGTYANSAYVRANNSLDANVGGTVTGNVTVQGDLSISGNVFVLGNTFSITAGSIVANDSLLMLGANNYYADILDIGFAGHYNDGTNAHSGLIRDFGTKEWYLFKGYTPEVSPNNNVILTDPSFMADTLNANLRSNNTIVRGIEIGYYANAAYLQANSAYAAQNVTGTYANNAYDQANSAASYANGAFVQANSAYAAQNVTGTYANNAYDQANSAASYANGAFVKANSAYASQNVTGTYANNAYLHANGAYIHANAAYDTINNLSAIANTTNTTIVAVNDHANAAFLQANSAYAAQNVTGTYANNAYLTANSGYIHANAAYNHANAAYESQNVTGTYANNAYLHANSSYASQNVTGTYANNAYLHANSAYAAQNVTGTYANNAYSTANAAFIHANAAFDLANNSVDTFVRAHANASYNTANAAFAKANAAVFSITSTTNETSVNTSTGNVLIGLANVNVNIGTFGGATAIPVINVDGKGRVLSVSNTTISVPPGTYIFPNTNQLTTNANFGNVLIGLANVNSNIGTFGSEFAVPTITTDGYGRVTSISNTTISIPQGTYIVNSNLITSNSSTGNVVLGLAESGVSAGVYGGAGKTPVLTVDVYGRVLVAANVDSAVNTLSTMVRNSFTATAAQTIFQTSTSFQQNYADVYVNGIKLSSADYSQNGILGQISLNSPVLLDGDVVDIQTATTYIVNSNTNYQKADFVATAGQTTVTVDYVPGQLNVYLNGLRLKNGTDYTAVTGTTIVFPIALELNDIVEVEKIGSAYIQIANSYFMTRNTITVTANGDTTFTVGGGYRVGYTDFYYNGIKLNSPNDVTATNGTTITLVDATSEVGDFIEVVGIGPQYSLANALPVTGGTIYGSLVVTQNVVANTVNVATVYFNDGTQMITAASGSGGTGITWKIISANTTANTTEGFLVNTTSANVYITLNASPSLGNTARIVDMAGNFAINNCIIKGNGNKVMGTTDDFIISSNNAGIGLVYSNATYGWRIIENP